MVRKKISESTKSLAPKIPICFLLILLLTLLCSCSKKISTESGTSQSAENAVELSAEKSSAGKSDSEKSAASSKSDEPKTSPSAMEDFLKEREGLYEKGGVALYDAGLIYDVPEGFERQFQRIFGVEDDYIPPEEPYSEIIIDFLVAEEDFLHIILPKDVYEKTPEIYLEAEHDGKTFAYMDKKPLDFAKEKNYSDVFLGYHCHVHFNNRNLYSNSDKWKISLKACGSDEVIAEKTISKKSTPGGYVVYSEEYESPFVGLENRHLEIDTRYHLIYKGKGGSMPDEGTMIVFSYCYYYDGGTGLLYIPFLGVKTKTDKGGVCNLDFSLREPGQYKIDFYDCETGKVTQFFTWDYLSTAIVEIKHVEEKGSAWKVSSAEGLRLRDAPWGKKLALLEDGTELIQTEDSLYPFYDFIDGQHGFWIPVKIKDKTIDLGGKEVFCRKPKETDGWVFSGFLEIER